MQIHFHKPERPRDLLLVCCGVLLLLIAGWMLLDYGKWRTIYQEMAEAISKKSLSGFSEQRKALSEEAKDLRHQVTVLERAAQVDKVEQSEIRRLISELQKENFELREELGFYKNILPEVSDGKGLKIKGLRLEALNEKQRYQLILILTRIIKGGTVAEIDVSISLHGSENGEKKDYDIMELLTEYDKKLNFRIKHFKRFSCEFRLPDNFLPDSVTVLVKKSGAKSKQTQQTYRWGDIQA